MTGPRQPPGAPYTALRLTTAPGTPTEGWCAACKANSRLSGALLLLAPGGVSTIGTYSWCDICEDPADQRGRDRG